MSVTLSDVYTPISWLDRGHAGMTAWRLRLYMDGTEAIFEASAISGQPKIQIANRLAPQGRASRRLSGSFVVRLLDGTPGLASVHQSAVRAASEIRGVLELLPPAGLQDSPAFIASGSLVVYTTDQNTAQLTFDIVYPSASRAVCRDASLLPGFGELEAETFLPQIFGRCSYHVPPLFTVQRARLLEPVNIDSTTLALASPADWPVPGRVQINDEVIDYTHISADGQTLGSEARTLARPHPREHDRWSAVCLIPKDDLAWCAADHGANVMEVRAESPDGNLLTEHEIVEEQLGVYTATLIRRASLPLVIGTARYTLDRQTDRERSFWTVLPETSAYDPSDAFAAVDPARGAVLTPSRPILSATFRRDLSTGNDRFDQLTSARLSFEFSDTPWWGPKTRLYVSIAKGDQKIEALINRDGVLVDVPVLAEGSMPKATARPAWRAWRRIGFQKAGSKGSALHLSAILDGHMMDSATLSAAAEPACIDVRFSSLPVESRETIRSARLCVHAFNPGASAVEARLTASIPGKLHRSTHFVAETFETVSRHLAFDLPTNVSGADLLGTDAVYTLAIPNGSLSVNEMWLEVEVEETLSADSWNAALTRLPVKGIASVRLEYNRVTLDAGPLLGGGGNWAFFSSDSNAPQVRFELVDGPDDPLWAVMVRDVHWAYSVYPSTSVRPVERLYVTTDGRLAREDGTANPAAVLKELIAGGQFGQASVDAESFAAAETEARARGIGFAAAFQEGTPLGAIIARAAGESTLAVAPGATGWRAILPPVEPEASVLPSLIRRDQLEHEGPLTIQPGPAVGASGLLLTHQDGSPLYRLNEGPRETIRLRWLVAGASVLARSIAARRRPQQFEQWLRAGQAWLALPPGAGISLPSNDLAADDFIQGEVTETGYENGVYTIRCSHLTSLYRPLETPGAAVQRVLDSGQVLFIRDGRVAARLLGNGDFLIAGAVREGAIPSIIADSELAHHPLYDFVLLSFSPDDTESSGLGIGPGGDVYTITAISARMGFMDGAPEDGVSEKRGDCSVFGGAAGGPAAMKITATRVLLRGKLYTHQQL